MKYKDAPDRYLNVFRLWFEFLQLTEPTSRSLDVREEFGEVENTSFEEWWPNHKFLFEEFAPFDVEVLNAPSDFDSFNGDPNILMIAINLGVAKEVLAHAFDELLSSRISNKPGPKKFEHLGKYYSLETRPDALSLQKSLKTWNLYVANPAWELQDLETKVGLLVKSGPHAHRLWKQVDCEPIFKARRKAQIDAVNRQLNWARTLLYNVALGVFPKSDSKSTRRREDKTMGQSAL